MGPDVVAGPLALALPVALLAGLVSFASPCVLPLVPGYLAYIGGFADGRSSARPGDSRGRARLASGVALFVLGFAVVFVAFGIAFGAAGFWLIQWRDLLTRLAGLAVIALGLVFLGRLERFQRTIRPSWRPVAGIAGAPLLGAVFAIGWTPCIGPTLGAILGLSLDGGSPWRGAVLGFAYALGLGIPFVLVALGFGWATRSVAFLRRHVRAVNVAGGVLLVVIGLLMVTGVWNSWMLQLGSVIGGYVTIL
ncbi:MAG: cytochrome biosis protein [Naasia sp.]|jgi:cytochrome c-type biogenesis protein|uniref:cytochrome c biogenesis CcdA family protein n=1 Tax=Naasia sp. TaxID=2546198 RepID=UPI002619E62D|nr:cytochrome c biogenesis protein CcdA [Naasia sp.]MCU1570645.1 cytochrome biosis protein [Naasia sp.]